MTDHASILVATREKLRQMRDRQKREEGVPYDVFHLRVAEALRERSGLTISGGWVRQQCVDDADPSYLRFGALINFLQECDAEKPTAAPSDDIPSDDAPSEDTPSEDLTYLARFREEQAKAKRKYKLDMSKPNPLMKASAKRKSRGPRSTS